MGNSSHGHWDDRTAEERNGHSTLTGIHPNRLANGLGWFSIGLGLSEIAAPGRVADLMGVVDNNDNRKMLRGLGMREVATGVGILANARPAEWMWGRFAGDLMDLAVLSSMRKADKSSATAATAAVLGVTALDFLCASQLSDGATGEARGNDEDRMICVRKAVTINRPVAEVYRFWRDFRNPPEFMDHLESVEILSDTRSRWRAKAPAGRTVEWEAEIIEDVPDRKISWGSVGKSDVENTGTVQFQDAPGDRGTEIGVDLRYNPPGGYVGSLFAKLFGEEPGQQINLRRFKQIMEVGEIPRSEGTLTGWRPAQPSAEPIKIQGEHR